MNDVTEGVLYVCFNRNNSGGYGNNTTVFHIGRAQVSDSWVNDAGADQYRYSYSPLCREYISQRTGKPKGDAPAWLNYKVLNAPPFVESDLIERGDGRVSRQLYPTQWYTDGTVHQHSRAWKICRFCVSQWQIINTPIQAAPTKGQINMSDVVQTASGLKPAQINAAAKLIKIRTAQLRNELEGRRVKHVEEETARINAEFSDKATLEAGYQTLAAFRDRVAAEGRALLEELAAQGVTPMHTHTMIKADVPSNLVVKGKVDALAEMKRAADAVFAHAMRELERRELLFNEQLLIAQLTGVADELLAALPSAEELLRDAFAAEAPAAIGS